MRSDVRAFELVSPATLPEVLALIAREPGAWRPIAGGTDLMVLLAAGKLPYPKLVNLWQLGELRGVQVSDTKVTLGALATYGEVQRHELLKREFPMLCQAAIETGGAAIQNRGTLGGNVVNASPAADSPPALLAYDAELELVSTRGVRLRPYAGFHTGYKKYDLAPDELLAKIFVPRVAEHRVHFYRKVGPRKAQAISKVCFAGSVYVRGGTPVVRVVLGGVAPVVLRCTQTEAVLASEGFSDAGLARAKEALAKEITPIDDVRSNKVYRSRVSLNLLEAFVRAARADVELGLKA